MSVEVGVLPNNPELWTSVVEALPTQVAVLPPEGAIVAANAAWRAHWGDPGAEGAGAAQLWDAEAQRGIDQVRTGDAAEFAFITAPSERHPAVRLVAERLPSAPGHILLRAAPPDNSEAKFRALYEATGDAVMLFEDGRMADCNLATAHLLGYERVDEVLGLHPWEFSPEYQPDGRRSDERAVERISTVLDVGVLRFEWTHTRADGSTFPADVMLSRIDRPGDAPVFQAVVRDISERKTVEQELRLSRASLARAQAIAHIGSWEWRIATDELGWSDEIYRIFGLEPQQFGATYDAFIACVHPGDRDMVQAAVERTLSGHAPYNIEHRVVRGDDSERIVHERGELVLGSDGTPELMIGTVQDITERRQVEDEIRRLNEELEGRVNSRTAELSRATDELETRQAEFQMLVETMNDGLTVVDADGIITYANAAFCRMLARTEDELRGADSASLLDETNREILARQIEMRMEGADEPYELMWTAADGRRVHSIVSPRPMFKDGEYTGSFAVMTDISRRKQVEEQLERALAELQRSNSALEDFAYVASHDLQEPLRKIVAFGGRIEKNLSGKLDDQTSDYFERMQSAAGRMQTLINDLLAFSRLTTKAQPFQPVDLAAVVDGVISDLEVRIEEVGGKVDVGCLPTIEADPLQVRQLMQNLIGNALKFSRDDTEPVVEVAGRLLPTRAPDDAPMCEITVQDNGIGFDAKYADRIFGVFERLHGRGTYEGTGMGLAICRKIVERHGGAIRAEGTDGEGARFTIELPVHHGEPEAQAT